MLPTLPRPWHPVVVLHGATARAFDRDDRSALLALAEDPAVEPWARAGAAQLAGMHAENAGDTDTKRRCLRLAHEGYARLGDRFGLGMTTFARGEVEDLAGDRAAARRAFLEAIALADELHKVDDQPQQRMQLAGLAARDGDPTEAREQLRLAEEGLDGTEEPWTWIWLAWGRADVERRLGHPEVALEELTELRATGTDGPGPGREQREAILHDLLAAALIDLGRYDEARAELEVATAAARAADDGPVIGQVAETGARLELAAGDPERARELLDVALTRRGTLHLGDPEVVATAAGRGFAL